MKFVCDRCHTRYSIADEKVRQRILRIRCKTCSNVITVQAGAVVTGAQDSPKRQEPVVGSPSASRPSSRLSLPPTRPQEWFVAVDGAEQGPLSCTTAAKYIVSLKPEQSVHVWKEGMDGWKRPKDVAIIAQEISALRRTPTRASSQMPVVPADASSARRPVPAPADSAARLQVPGSRPKPPPAGGAGSGPNLPQPGISGSSPRLSPPLPGSGPKPPPVPGSGPKAAPSPVSGSGPKAPPVSGHGAKPALAGGPGLKTPAPVSGLGAKLASAGGHGRDLAQVPDSKLPAGGLSLKPGPALPGLTPSSPPPPPPAAPGLGTEFENAPSTKPEKRPSQTQGVAALGTDSARPTAASGPRSDDEFDQAQKTPLPSKPLPPIAVEVGDGHPLGHPPALPPPIRRSGTGAAVAGMKPPSLPAAAAGSLFGNVTPPPEGGRVQSDLSKLAVLAQRHRHLKYVVAAGVVVVLVVLVILLSWRGESGKTATPVLEREGEARVPEAPSLGEGEPPSQNQAAAATEAAHKGRTNARGASRRSAGVRAAGRSGKAAAVGEDPFEAPSPSSHLVERPVPVQMPGQSRGSHSGSPGGAGREVSQEQIAAVVRSKENQSGLKTCYERALRRDGRLRTGRLDITVSVGENGTVRRVQVHGPSDFLVIDDCIKDAIRHWRFPANPEEYATSFPLILQGG